MLVQLNSIIGLFIPDDLVTGEVIQALLKATNAEAFYEKDYKWKPANDKILIHVGKSLTVPDSTEAVAADPETF